MIEVPILRQGNILIASVQDALSDQGLLGLQDRLAREVGFRRITGVIIDVTVLDVMDSFAVRILRTIAEIIKLRGARTVIVGIQPEVAIAMVRLGLRLTEVDTALDLDDGLCILKSQPRRGARFVWKPASKRAS